LKPSAFTFLSRGYSQVRRYGLKLLWLRYFRRRTILKAPQVHCPEDAAIEVHMQVCARDWLNGLWTISSFRHFCGRPFQLVIFCDDSVTETMQAHMRHHCVGADVLPCGGQSNAVRETFESRFPELWRLRTSGRFFTLPKVMDSYAARRRDVVLSIDPDVLFFAPPDELLVHEPGTFARFNVPRTNTDRRGGFSIDEQALNEQFGITFPPRFGCGLGWIDYAKADWELIERILRQIPPDPERAFLLDQTITAIWCAVHGWNPLPPERYSIEPVESLEGVVARHYYSKTRDLFYLEGMPQQMGIVG
jgi:hypothetical protein